jgi:hypothetical protein
MWLLSRRFRADERKGKERKIKEKKRKALKRKGRKGKEGRRLVFNYGSLLNDMEAFEY